MLPITEIVRGRVRSKKYATPGDRFPAITTDSNTSCIMMSKIKIHRYDRQNYSDRFDVLTKINKIGNTLCVYRLKCLKESGEDITDTVLQNDVVEKVMSETIWRLLNSMKEMTKETCEELYSNILQNPSMLLEGTSVFADDDNIMKFINSRIARGEVTLSNEFDLITYQDVNELKRVLNSAKEVEIAKDYSFSIKSISSPLYAIFVTGLSEDKVKEILTTVMKKLDDVLDKKNTRITMKEEYKSIGKPETFFSALSLLSIID